MKMNPTLRNILLVLVDSLLFFAIFAILPFAWILRDGLGPDSVSTTGLAALPRIFMTFYVGPAILILLALDLILRKRSHEPESNPIISRKVFIIPVIILLILMALGAGSYLFMGERQHNDRPVVATPTVTSGIEHN